MATNAQLETLEKALSYDRPPFCSGTVLPSPEGFHLYYGKQDPRFIDFASSTPEQLDQLAVACDPATFGRGNQDVHDESYRKALKMDAAGFAVQFDPTAFGLIKTIEEGLLQGRTQKMRIRPEIYKLNVYGKDSFFKAHKDTPRGTDMFGSLVIVYPTAHQGGELVLRHKEHEWTFDANVLTSLQSSPSLAYVAFYSDVEHEVLKVTSGSRVTLTYNLYMVPLKVPVPSDPPAASVKPSVKTPTNFQATLHQLLKSPEFMPEGGTLAFGLAHLYPITFDMESDIEPDTGLQKIITYLKGEDAHVFESCRELELEPALRMIYSEGLNRAGRSSHGVMMETIVHNPNYDYNNSDYKRHLVEELGGVSVNLFNGVLAAESRLREELMEWGDGDSMEGCEQLTWLTDFTKSANELKDMTIAFGNDVSVGYIYCSPCLIVRIRPAIDRI